MLKCAALLDAKADPPIVVDWGALVSSNAKKTGGSENKGYITLQCTKATVNVEVLGLNTVLSAKVLSRELTATVLNSNLSCSRMYTLFQNLFTIHNTCTWSIDSRIILPHRLAV